YEYWCLGAEGNVFFEPVGIFMAILLATGLAFYFELKAGKEFELLNKVNDEEPVETIRNGGVRQVARSEIVVGDIVRLNTGQEVPADGRLIESVSLTVDESTLTGEPLASKSAREEDADPHATFPTSAVMRGSKIMEGHGVMIVEAVGDATEDGKVFRASQIDDSVKTPLREQLDRLGKLIAYASYVIGALIIVGRTIMYLTSVDFDWIGFVDYMLKTVMIAVTLVVVAVPEGLPMAVTLSLAYSMRRMLKTNNLVRKLHACETMGAATVICTDKTGTLTQNCMQVGHTNFFGNPSEEIIEAAIAVNSTAELDLSGEKPKVIGNPTEGALLLWLRERGVDYSRIRKSFTTLAEIPFSTERKYMATAVRGSDGNSFLFVKGAPEIIMSMAEKWPDGVSRRDVNALLLGYQEQAMRTLGFAYRTLSAGETPDPESPDLSGLTFMGITAISDPVREDVPAAVSEVMDAGIKIKIVTGDTPATAREIGRRIGLWNDETDNEMSITTGPEFEAMSDEEISNRLGEIKIIARARPMDKKRLVELLQKNGEVVAVTGDGTNDAPALKAAHVGLSMGDGTAVAKEASDITIIDNSFASIVRAVIWGRSLYRNIQRFIMFQLTVNVAACLIVLVGSFMGLQSPLTVTQMLWVNLIMDSFAAVALASLPPSEEVMRDKPRDRRDSIITRGMKRFIIGGGSVFFLIMFGMLLCFDHSDITTITEIFSQPWLPATTMNPTEVSLFFTTFVFLQFWNMFNARVAGSSHNLFTSTYGKGFWLIMVMIFAGQILIVEIGGQFFNVVPLSLTDWLIIIAGTAPVALAGVPRRIRCRR
ncbi:MAG: calcium-translocating P-type ATPase, PMCA-type, partial [Paramuribaculum sp.]|nr:calcium-translocating P-type ATPase, PMCA-type [Paramuribaculum sp.]